MASKDRMFDANSDQLTALRDRASEILESQYGRSATWSAAAPGRVNLIGEHTDYNGGYVLPMAIDRYVVAVAAPRDEPRERGQPTARCYSADFEKEETIKIGGKIEPGAATWSSYVQGVVAGYVKKGFEFQPFDMVVHSNVPVGGGLSSSAALEVATATLIESIFDKSLDPAEKALLCHEAENTFAGVPCGIMDQFSSVFGEADSLMLLDCRAHTFELVPMASEVAVLIANTNVKHELTGGEYERRRTQCETAARTLGVTFLRDATIAQLEEASGALDSISFCRARHVIGEIARTIDAAEALRQRDYCRVGDLMYASHESLRDDYDVSCPELDTMVDIARRIGEAGGIYGSRMTGAGFGGCTVSLVATEQASSIADQMRENYQKQTGITPSLFVTGAVPGARQLQQINSDKETPV